MSSRGPICSYGIMRNVTSSGAERSLQGESFQMAICWIINSNGQNVVLKRMMVLGWNCGQERFLYSSLEWNITMKTSRFSACARHHPHPIKLTRMGRLSDRKRIACPVATLDNGLHSNTWLCLINFIRWGAKGGSPQLVFPFGLKTRQNVLIISSRMENS